MTAKVVNLKFVKDTPPNKTIFVLGSPGCGKTTLIANLALKESRTVVFDSKDDYPKEFFENCVVCQTSEELLAALNQQKKRIVVQLFKRPEFAEETIDECCNLIFQVCALNQGKFEVCVVIDEMNRYVATNQCPTGIHAITQLARSTGVTRIYGAQWFGTIPTWMRDGFSEIYTFRHSDETGLSRLEQFGFDSEHIRNLPPYHCARTKNGVIEILNLCLNK